MIEFGPVRGGDIPRNPRRPSAVAEASTSRALVAVSPARPRDNVRQTPPARSSAPFLAHLIATAEGFPQTREKRRLAPEDASRAYADAQTRKSLRRSQLGSL